MKTIQRIFKASILLIFSITAKADFVTLVTNNENPTKTLTLSPSQSAEYAWHRFDSATIITVSTQGIIKDFTGSYLAGIYNPGIKIAGPATITMTNPSTSPQFITFDVKNQSPSQVMVIPVEQGAVVELQTSEDLENWSTIFAETYTNVSKNKFFRIRLQRQ